MCNEVFEYKGENIPIKLFSSKKYKSLSISVNKNYVRISKPIYITKSVAISFLDKNKDKIFEMFNKLNNSEEICIKENDLVMIKGEKFILKVIHSNINKFKIKIVNQFLYFYVPDDMDQKKLQQSFTKCFKNYLKEETKKILNERLIYWSKVLKESYNKVSIKCQKTVWGSAVVSKRNLNFNMKIAMLSNEVIDYIIIHELCHFKEANHSKKFWNQVEKYDRDYKEHKRYLKENVKFFDII